MVATFDAGKVSLRRVGRGAKRRAHHLSPIEPQDGGHASLCPPYSPAPLRSDLLLAQAQIPCTSATNQHDSKSLLIFRNRVKPSAQKYSAFASTQISRITPRVSPDERGARERHERAVGCGGRWWRTRRRRRMRTAKSCGSGAAVLALSSRKQAFAGDGGKRAVLREEHEVSRKAIAQGRPGCSACTCMLVCAFLCASGTRDRGCSKHPVFPAPSLSSGGTQEDAKLGRNAPRDREVTSACRRQQKRATWYSGDARD
jgi:hypothetical protein